MKKLVFLLIAAMLISCFAGCQKKAETTAETAEEPETAVAGGWSCESAEGIALPEAVQAAFDTACEGYTESALTPLACLGSQVVAGTNYAVLCVSEKDGTKAPVVAIVYAALDGTAEITKVTALDVASYRDAESGVSEDGSDLAGGWTVSEDTAADLSEKPAEAFETAFDGFTGVGYEPLALVGTQVVSGVNYAYVCRGTVVTAEPVTGLYLVYVYAALDGTAEILNIAPLDIADFNN